MSWQTWLLAILIAFLGLTQYGLMAYAIRDLLRRPRVRGGNKVTWALVILTLPFVGALLYTVYGPTSFIPRANRPPTRPPGWEDRGEHAALKRRAEPTKFLRD